MRNLKRALSLTLASVMLLGMMVIGTSAVAGYSDVDADDNVEAIEVLQAIEVMVGDDRGFGPDRPVNRAEMAVVMGLLLNLDYNYYVSTCPFADVSGNYEWARGWVGACAANGIVSGRGEGIYDPAATVTAIEAASMMMRALGYFQNAEDYNDGFVLVTVRQGNQIGIFNGVGSDGSTPMTRNQVAQMALNALKANMVDFTGTLGIEVNGVKIGYQGEYTFRSGTDRKYFAISSQGNTTDGTTNQAYVQLGEELYDGDLKLRDNAGDDFERPARNWEYKGKEIGTYAKYELMSAEYTTAINGKTLYDLLGKSVIDENDVEYYWNGRLDETVAPNNMIRTNTKDYDTTGKGVLTQVFFEDDKDLITIVSIDTFLADVDDDYDEKKGELPIVNIYTNRADAASVQFSADTKVGVDEVAGIEKYKDGDKVMVQVAWTGSRYEIVNVMDPEVLKDVSLNKYSEENYVARSGEQWDYALDGKDSKGALDEITEYDTKSLTDYTYTLYLDQYGYLIGNERSGGSDEYVFIAGYDFRGSNLATATATASAIFLDGTMANIQVNVNETQKNIQAYNTGVWEKWVNSTGTGNLGTTANQGGYLDFNVDTSAVANKAMSEYNSWFTYTTETKNGVTVYTLEPVDNWMAVDYSTNGKINSSSVRLDSSVGFAVDSVMASGKYTSVNTRAYSNDDSVFLTVETDDVSEGTVRGISKVNGRYTGVDDVDMKVLANTDPDYGLDKTNGVARTVTWDGTDSRVAINQAGVKNKSSVFAVYDDDRYIIGAVIVGDNGGANTDYIYVLDDIKNERVEDGDHYWEVDVAKGGKVETLTIKASSSKFRTIRTAIQNAMNLDTPEAVNGMLKLTYDADGYVTDADAVVDANITDVVYGNTDAKAKEKIDTDDEKVYLVQYDATLPTGSVLGATSFHASGRTLYSEDFADDQGLRVVKDAPVVVLQPTKDSKGNIDYDYETFTGSKSVENAIKSLANRGANFQGWIAAVLNSNGDAEYLVLSSEICKTIDTVDPDAGYEGKRIEGPVEDTVSGATTDKFPGLPAGGYVFSDKPTDKAGDMNGNAEDNMFFLTKWDDSKAFNATLTIKDASGKIVYREYTSSAAAGSPAGIKTPYFYVQLVGAGVNNRAKGYDLSDAALKTGEYTWTITGLNIEEVNGSFEIR